MRVKMSKPPPPAPTASAIGPCPTVIKIVGRPGTGSLPSTIAPPDHPLQQRDFQKTDTLYFFGYNTVFFFTFQNNPKNPDPNYKMDLDLWNCLERVKLVL